MSEGPNSDGRGHPQSRSVPELFEGQALQSPDAVALLFHDRELTYRELNQKANRIAHRLRRLGVKRGSRVGLCIERSPELVSGILGILKVGAAYVPLDPDYPEQRFAFMMEDSGVSLVLSHVSTARCIDPFRGKITELCVDSQVENLEDESSENEPSDATAEDLAYVMYTSGSTGNPKGVMVTHRAITRLVRNTDYCDFGVDQIFLLLAPISFDASTFEVWGPLLNGARLAIMPPGAPSLDELGAAIRRHGVTTLWLTAGLFHLMVDHRPQDLRGIRQLLAGGDVLSPRHVERALAALDGGTVINGYGPTESTTFACCFRMTADYQVSGSIPIGQPISSTQVHILDSMLRAVPTGVSGELFIGGDGLALGYLNQPELTRERFIADPFSTEPGARLYRTGDRARQRADGNIEFLGRLDRQVKIAGYRIEPGEIEAILAEHPLIRQAVVDATEDPSGQKRLAAYFVPVNSGGLDVEELKRFVVDRLPAFMIPSSFTALEQLPLSPNGKVDRALLAEARRVDRPEGSSVPPGTPLEQTIARVWSTVLHRLVGLNDNFFDLGGSSLQLIEVHSELQRVLASELPITDLFEFSTVRALAGRINGVEARGPALAAARERGRRQKDLLVRQRQTRGIHA